MSNDVLLRQATFDTDPSDRLVSQGDTVSSRRGGYELPVIDDVDEHHRGNRNNSVNRTSPSRRRQESPDSKGKQIIYKQSPRSKGGSHKTAPSPKKQTKRNMSDDEYRESYDSVVSERNSLLRSDNIYKKRIKQLEDEANDFLLTIESLTRENKELREIADGSAHGTSNSNKKGRPSSTSSDRQTINDLRTENKNLIQQLHNERNQNEKLLHTIKDLEDSAEVKDMQAKKGGGDDKKAAAEKLKLLEDLKKTKIENSEMFEQNVRYKDENYSNIKKIHGYEREIEKLKTSISDNENNKFASIQDLENRNAFLTSDKKDLKLANTELEHTCQTLEEEIRQLKVKRDEDGLDIGKLNKIIDSKEKLETESGENKREAERNKRKLTELTTYYEDLQKQHETVKKSEVKLKETNIKYIDELSRNRKSADRKGRENRTNADQLEKAELELSEIKVSFEKNSDILNAQRNTTKKQSVEVNKLKVQVDKLNKDLNSTLDERDKLRDVESEHLRVRREFDQNKATLRQLKIDHGTELKRLDEQHTESLTLELNKITLEKQKLDEQSKESEELKSKMEMEIFEANMRMKSVVDKIRAFEEENKKHAKDNSELETNHKKVVLENAHLRKLLGMDSNSNKDIVSNETFHTAGNKAPKPKRVTASKINDTDRGIQKKSNNLSLPSIGDSESSRDPTPDSKTSSSTDGIRPVNFGGSYRKLHKKKLEFQHR